MMPTTKGNKNAIYYTNYWKGYPSSTSSEIIWNNRSPNAEKN